MKPTIFSLPKEKKKKLFETQPVSHSRKRKGYQEFPWQSVDGTKLGRKPLQNAK